MPTGVPANQLNEYEARAVYLVLLDALTDDTIPEGVNRGDLIQAFRKLTAQQVSKTTAKKPKRKVKKGSEKAE